MRATAVPRCSRRPHARNPLRAAYPWWDPSRGTPLPPSKDYTDPSGQLRLLNSPGPWRRSGHPFFTPLGSNGRACVTCHQPTSAMSLSLDLIRPAGRTPRAKTHCSPPSTAPIARTFLRTKKSRTRFCWNAACSALPAVASRDCLRQTRQAGFPDRSRARPNRLQQEPRFHFRVPPPARRRQSESTSPVQAASP